MSLRARPGLRHPAGISEKGRGRIAITNVRRERLGAIPHEGALREGFPTVGAFFGYWWRLHGEVDLKREVWVIERELELEEERIR